MSRCSSVGSMKETEKEKFPLSKWNARQLASAMVKLSLEHGLSKLADKFGKTKLEDAFTFPECSEVCTSSMAQEESFAESNADEKPTSLKTLVEETTMEWHPLGAPTSNQEQQAQSDACCTVQQRPSSVHSEMLGRSGQRRSDWRDALSVANICPSFNRLYEEEAKSSSTILCNRTAVEELTFMENISHVMIDASLSKKKVAIVVTTDSDGVLLASALKTDGHHASFISKEMLKSVSYDNVLKGNEAVVLPADFWKQLGDVHKTKASYLVVALRPGKTDSSILLFEGYDTLEKIISIPYVYEADNVYPPASSVQDVPVTRPVKYDRTKSEIEVFSESVELKSTALERNEPETKQETRRFLGQKLDLTMLLKLQDYTRETISGICKEINQTGTERFQEMEERYYGEAGCFCNMLQNWIDKACSVLTDQLDPRLCCLKETCKAASLIELVGPANIPFIFGPPIHELDANASSTDHEEDYLFASVRKLKQILQIEEQIQPSIDFHGTEWLLYLVREMINSKNITDSFRGLIIVQSRVAIHATSLLLRNHPELSDISFLLLYSSTKDRTTYPSRNSQNLRMTKTERETQLTKFRRMEKVVLVTIGLNEGSCALPPLDIVVLFGCTSDIRGASFQAKKKVVIEPAHTKAGKIQQTE